MRMQPIQAGTSTAMPTSFHADHFSRSDCGKYCRVSIATMPPLCRSLPLYRMLAATSAIRF
jgi:hypothetical protein